MTTPGGPSDPPEILDRPPDAVERWFIAAALAAASGLLGWVAWTDQGLFWPDEIFQSVEQAHRVAFGHGLVPWEFRLGARSWLFPGALGVAVKAVGLLDPASPRVAVLTARTVMVGLSALGLWASMMTARRLGGRTALVIAGLWGATFPPTVLFGSRCMSEIASGALVAAAAWCGLQGSRRALLATGALAGLAAFTRYQSGLLALGLLVELALRHRRKGLRDLRPVLHGLAGAVALGAVLDWVTWGRPFHSLIEYVNFNLVQGRASAWGREPAFFYVQALWAASPVGLVLVAAGLAVTRGTARSLAIVALAFALLHSAIPHKELRFLMPMVPLALGVAAVGLARLLDRRLAAGLSMGAAGVVAVLFLWRVPRLTFGELGQWSNEPRGNLPAWRYGDGLNRALWGAGARSDLCGLVFHDIRHWSGGYSYLHQDVPAVWGLNRENADAANYVVSFRSSPPPPPYELAERFGEYAIYRRAGPCTPPPASFTYFMPGP